MKKLVTGIGLLMLLSFGVTAQQTKDSSQHKSRFHKKRSYNDLNLTESQKAQMKTANADFRKKMTALKTDNGLAAEDLKVKRAELVKEHRTKVESILTADQRTKLQEKRKTHKDQKQVKGNSSVKMKQELALTDEQSSKLKSLHEVHKKKIMELRENKSLDEESRKAKVMSLRKEHREAMNLILTAEQKKKMKEFRTHKNKKEQS